MFVVIILLSGKPKGNIFLIESLLLFITSISFRIPTPTNSNFIFCIPAADVDAKIRQKQKIKIAVWCNVYIASLHRKCCVYILRSFIHWLYTIRLIVHSLAKLHYPLFVYIQQLLLQNSFIFLRLIVYNKFNCFIHS